jgi:uncharacterized membrane protein
MKAEKRFPELDALRGIAVFMMVLYHLLFDLAYFYGWDIPVYEGFWKIFARVAAMLFLLLVGICFVISWERGGKYPKYLRRSLIIFSGGMIISLITYFIAKESYVRFGILHLIGISALLQPLFAPFKKWNALLGAALLLTFYTFTPSLPPTPSLDYFPLLPWFPIILIGMGGGFLLYAPRKHLLERFDAFRIPKILLWSGRYSLWIYFVHQPVLLMLLSLALGRPFPA